MKKKITISVRNLAEYSFRSGDLSFDALSQSNPREAIFAHQKIQKSRPEAYTGEVSISNQFETEKYILDINGRMDGIFRYPDRIIIEEIKTTVKNLEYYENFQNPSHWAQLKIYCYLFTVLEDIEKIEGQLTYYNLDTGSVKEFLISFTRKGLKEFFEGLLSKYLKRIEAMESWWRVRDKSIKGLDFPFKEYRAGQRDMAVEVFTAVKQERDVLIQAPTGIGKTMSALFPSVKALAEAISSKIFYLTARTTGKDAAENAINEMRIKGLKIKSLTITAKDKICFEQESACTPDECEFARGYFDRVDDAVEHFFREDSFSKETIEKIAGQYRVCPFEFSLELSLMADVVICDYNYVFDPRVYLRRFFLEEKNDYILLIDEAHNLVERAREMFSAEISKQAFLDTRRSLQKTLPGIYKKIGHINSQMLKYRKLCEERADFFSEPESPSKIIPCLKKFLKSAEEWLVLDIVTDFRETLLDLYYSVRAFVRMWEDYDSSYNTIYEKSDADLRLKLFCIDPSNRLEKILSKVRSAVFFSATMSPPNYFRRIFGCSEDVKTVEIPSPFPPENLCLVIYDGVSTVYKNREKTKTHAADLINPIVNSKKGNYLVFFPSYVYMQMILGVIDSGDFNTVIQSPGMSEDDRSLFLNRFSKGNEDTLVGFAVMGGVFGEGIDLTGDRLSGAVIYGVGLPGVSPERDIIREYFTTTDQAGFEYAYLYPGINRVLQAAGRVIRSEKDRGVVILIDERYKSFRYKSLFPVNWRPVRVNKSSQLNSILEKFWNGR